LSGHDEKRIIFNLLEEAFEVLVAFSVRLLGARLRAAPVQVKAISRQRRLRNF
jgi:hypothetical protein